MTGVFLLPQSEEQVARANGKGETAAAAAAAPKRVHSGDAGSDLDSPRERASERRKEFMAASEKRGRADGKSSLGPLAGSSRIGQCALRSFLLRVQWLYRVRLDRGADANFPNSLGGGGFFFLRTGI